MCYFGATAGCPDDSMTGIPGTDQSEEEGKECMWSELTRGGSGSWTTCRPDVSFYPECNGDV